MVIDAGRTADADFVGRQWLCLHATLRSLLILSAPSCMAFSCWSFGVACPWALKPLPTSPRGLCPRPLIGLFQFQIGLDLSAAPLAILLTHFARRTPILVIWADFFLCVIFCFYDLWSVAHAWKSLFSLRHFAFGLILEPGSEFCAKIKFIRYGYQIHLG